jgi:hypothetical protein
MALIGVGECIIRLERDCLVIVSQSPLVVILFYEKDAAIKQDVGIGRRYRNRLIVVLHRGLRLLQHIVGPTAHVICLRELVALKFPRSYLCGARRNARVVIVARAASGRNLRLFRRLAPRSGMVSPQEKENQ